MKKFFIIVVALFVIGCIHEVTKPDGSSISTTIDAGGLVDVINAVDNATK